MGGDVGPAVMVAGAALAWRSSRRPLTSSCSATRPAIRAELAAHDGLAGVCEIIHCDGRHHGRGQAEPGDPPRQDHLDGPGDRRGEGRARPRRLVSGGNTGALMAMSKLALRTMPGIDRPALAALLPTLGENDLVMLDLGANTECDAQNLVQFAVMGAAYARVVLELPTAARPAAQHRHRGAEGHGRIEGRRRDPARRGSSPHALRRLHRGRQDCRAATST